MAQNDYPSLRLSMLIIAAGTISTSLAQPDLLDLPIRRLLKDELGASESQMAMLFGIGALAWYVKPVAGLLVDGIALFGTHRRYYLIISALLAAALWVLLGMVSHSYLLLLAGVVAMQCMLVIGSTVLGGFLVERGKLLRAEGRLVSCRMFVEQACVLIAGPLAGYLAGLPFGTAALIGAAIAVVVVPFAAVCVTEPIQEKSTLRTRRPVGLRSISILVPTIPDAMAPSSRNNGSLYRNSSLPFLCVAPHCAHRRISEWVSLRDRDIGGDAERGYINVRFFRRIWVCSVYECVERRCRHRR